MPIFPQMNRPSSRDFEPGTEAILQTGDALMAVAQVTVATIEAAKARALGRERARLAFKYGADAPQVQRVASVRRVQERVASAIAAAADLATLEKADFEPGKTAFHGRVVGVAAGELSNVKVEAVDASGKVVASATPGESGYYALDLTAVATAPATAAGAAAPGAPVAPAVRLVVRRLDGQVTSERPVETVPIGAALWRELVVPGR